MRENGANARRWLGDKAGYVAKHMWLTKHYPKLVCQHCLKARHEVSRLEWANISGEYKRERSDYLSLCPSCHRKMDLKKTHCPENHPREGNSKLNNRGHIICIACSRENSRRYRRKLNVSNN
jgi:hypothetical protein